MTQDRTFKLGHSRQNSYIRIQLMGLLHYHIVDRTFTLKHSRWDNYIKTYDRTFTLEHSSRMVTLGQSRHNKS